MATRDYVKLGPALDAEAAVLRRYLKPGGVGDAYAEAVNRQLALLVPRPSETPREIPPPEPAT